MARFLSIVVDHDIVNVALRDHVFGADIIIHTKVFAGRCPHGSPFASRCDGETPLADRSLRWRIDGGAAEQLVKSQGPRISSPTLLEPWLIKPWKIPTRPTPPWRPPIVHFIALGYFRSWNYAWIFLRARIAVLPYDGSFWKIRWVNIAQRSEFRCHCYCVCRYAMPTDSAFSRNVCCQFVQWWV